MARESAQRQYNALHEDQPFHDGTFTRWAKEQSPSTPFHYSDGVTIWVAEQDLTPDDMFLGKSLEVTPEALRQYP